MRISVSLSLGGHLIYLEEEIPWSPYSVFGRHDALEVEREKHIHSNVNNEHEADVPHRKPVHGADRLKKVLPLSSST